ncbi:MAG TPA: hypothetical protein PLV92_24850, partial [Pirellulaceae bacterium]|nr:hypothetical protein [Pirellulaceae bacterium]
METQQVDWDCLSTSYVEAMLEEYLRDPSKVPEAWRETFARMAEELDSAGDSRRTRFRPSFGPSSLFNPTSAFTGVSQRAGTGLTGGLTTVSTASDASSAGAAANSSTAATTPRLVDSGATSGRGAGVSSSAAGAAAGQYGQM